MLNGLASLSGRPVLQSCGDRRVVDLDVVTARAVV